MFGGRENNAYIWYLKQRFWIQIVTITLINNIKK